MHQIYVTTTIKNQATGNNVINVSHTFYKGLSLKTFYLGLVKIFDMSVMLFQFGI